MKFGVMFANAFTFADPGNAVAIAQGAEEAGFESIWTVEHVVVPVGYESQYPYSPTGKMPGTEDVPIPDPLVWLAWVAGQTSSIRLATGILILPQRNPVVTAKAVATLDALSGGRVILGVGAGWLREEFDALGVPFERRGARLDDGIAALRALWTQDQPTHRGEFYEFTGAVCSPRPVSGTVPIVIGGHTDAAARRAGRIGDGFFPGRGDPESLEHLFAVMRRAAEEAGRDPDAIELTTGAHGNDPDTIKRMADLGISRLVIGPPAFDAAGVREGLARFGDEVIAKVG
jgi:probable F420-dependent oxidoreductase